MSVRSCKCRTESFLTKLIKIWFHIGVGIALLQAGLRFKRYKAMAEGAILEGIEERYRSKIENGRYVIPWGGSRPSNTSVLQWWFGAKDNSSVGGSWKQFWKFNDEELKKELPLAKKNTEGLLNPPQDQIQVTWIGHATVLVQMDGLNILADPVFNDFCGPFRFGSYKRYRPLPYTVEDLPDIDAVVISHNHFDHLDYKSVKDLNNLFGQKICWYVPMGTGKWMRDCGCENVQELDWWEKRQHGSVSFYLTPSQHWCRRGVTDENRALWGGWAIVGPQHRFFFGGDSGYCDVFKVIGDKFGPFDLAALPIGAYEPRWFMKFQHTDPQGAVEMHKDLKAKRSVAIHWGTFALAYEHYMAPKKELLETLDRQNIDRSEFFVLKHGETKIL